MTETATIDWFGRWGTCVFSENTAIFYFYSLIILTFRTDRSGQNSVNPDQTVLLGAVSSGPHCLPVHL